MVATVTLPSGRVVELHEPTIVEEIQVVAKGVADLAELMWAKMEVIVPTVTREMIDGHPNFVENGVPFTREDGRALGMAVGRMWDGRPEEQEAPFENGSVSLSTDSSPKAATTPQPTRS